VVVIQKYTCKWMARRVYLKLLSATIFIQCCYRQLCARKELQRLKQEAKEFSYIVLEIMLCNFFYWIMY